MCESGEPSPWLELEGILEHAGRRGTGCRIRAIPVALREWRSRSIHFRGGRRLYEQNIPEPAALATPGKSQRHQGSRGGTPLGARTTLTISSRHENWKRADRDRAEVERVRGFHVYDDLGKFDKMATLRAAPPFPTSTRYAGAIPGAAPEFLGVDDPKLTEISGSSDDYK